MTFSTSLASFFIIAIVEMGKGGVREGGGGGGFENQHTEDETKENIKSRR